MRAFTHPERSEALRQSQVIGPRATGPDRSTAATSASSFTSCQLACLTSGLARDSSARSISLSLPAQT
jgi:hypothetical protein